MCFFSLLRVKKKIREGETERNCAGCIHRVLIYVRHMHVLWLYVAFVVALCACMTRTEEQTERQSTVVDVLKVVKLVDALTDESMWKRPTMAAWARKLMPFAWFFLSLSLARWYVQVKLNKSDWQCLTLIVDYLVTVRVKLVECIVKGISGRRQGINVIRFSVDQIMPFVRRCVRCSGVELRFSKGQTRSGSSSH